MFVLCLLLISRVQALDSPVCSSAAHLSTTYHDSFSNDGGGKITETVITTTLRQGETICFSVGEVGQVRGSGTRFALTMTNHRARYSYKNLYQFGVPKVEAECTCQCTSLENQCTNSGTDLCEDRDNCANAFFGGQSISGCVKLISGQSSSVCCGVWYTEQAQVWQGVELVKEDDKVTLDVTQDYYVEGAEVEHFNLNLGKTNEVTDNFEMIVTRSDSTSALLSQWYYGRVGHTDLYEASRGINAKDEYQVTKLGWLKYNEETGKFTSPNDWKDAYTVSEVTNCGQNEFKSQFTGVRTDDEASGRKSIQDKYTDTIQSVVRDDAGRQVTFDYIDSSKEFLVKITCVNKGQFPVAQYTDDSTLTALTAEVFIDEHNNRYVNLTISGGGTIKGAIQDLEQGKVAVEETFELNIPIGDKIIRLIKLQDLNCSEASIIKLTAYPDTRQGQGGGDIILENVKCNLKPIPGFQLPDNTIETTGSEKSSLFSVDSWTKYLNPFEWFTDGIGGWQEGVMMMVVIVGVMVLIGIVLKIARVMGCLGKCCSYMFCCCLCKKTEEKFHRQRRYTQQSIKRWGSTTKRRMTVVSAPIRKKLQPTPSQRKIMDRLARRPTMVDLARRMGLKGSEEAVEAVIFNNESATIIDNEIKNQDSEKGGKVGEGEHKVLEEQRSRKTTVKFSDVKYSDV